MSYAQPINEGVFSCLEGNKIVLYVACYEKDEILNKWRLRNFKKIVVIPACGE